MINSRKSADSRAAHALMFPARAGLIAIALGLSLSACTSPARAVKDAAPAQPATEGLLIQGYNYTDTYINSFTVNGAGGGNIFVSSPTSGGGGSVCCYSFNPSVKSQVTVRWSAGYCMYSTTNKFGGTHQWRKSLFKEVQIPVEAPRIDERPMALEVHFYPDGHVEAAVTPGYSPPRLKLPITADEQRPGASNQFPPCSHDQLQESR